MVEFVLDSSALLAVILAERGSEKVVAVLQRSAISAVNMAEVVSKLNDDGFNEQQISAILSSLNVRIISFDETQSFISGNLRNSTKHRGLSLGDRCCFALAIQQKAIVMTADKVWVALALGVKVELLR